MLYAGARAQGSLCNTKATKGSCFKDTALERLRIDKNQRGEQPTNCPLKVKEKNEVSEPFREQ